MTQNIFSMRWPAVVLSLMLLVLSATSNAQTGDIAFDQVQIVGTSHIDSSALKMQLSKTSGTLSRTEITEEIKSLYKTGFFDDVNVALKSEQGKQILVYSVVEKPSVKKVFIKGNKEVSEKDLAAIITFDAKRFFDRSKVTSVVRNAVTFYQQKGFLDAAIDYSVVPATDGQVDLIFTVKEGEKFTIDTITFEGLDAVDEDELLSAIQTKRYKWWNSWITGTGRVNQELLDNDKLIVRQYLFDHGFLESSISGPRIERAEGTELKVVFEIKEGAQFNIGTITAQGDLIDNSAEETLKGIKSKEGSVFGASQVRGDSFIISDKFGDRGYAFANVVPNTSIDHATQKVNLEFEVTKGKPVTIDRINIRGNDKTYDNVIRRELTIQEQDQYSTSKVRRSQELLQRLGYFEEANIATEPAADPEKVDLNVNVRESSTGTFSVGAGYSSSDGALFNTRLSEANVWGTGRKLDLNVDIGTERNNAILSLDDRRFNDSYWSVGQDINITEREYEDFDRKTAGAGVTVGYPLERVFGEQFQDTSFSTKYEYIKVDISDIDVEDAAQLVIDSEGTSTASGITPRIVRNTINNPLNPIRGSRQIFEVELTGLGGSERFYLAEFRNQYYRPLSQGEWGELVFSWRLAAGYGKSFDGDPLPLYRRYFPGGINSVRGFKARRLGPKDEDGNEYGGAKQFVNNLEIIFPLINSAGLRGIFFYDVGEAFDDKQSIKIEDLRQAYGTGIRWNSPMGPIRLEVGRPIAREEGEKSVVTLFSFGAPF